MDIGPYNLAEPITKSDTVNFANFVTKGLSDAIYVGGAGIVVAIMDNNDAVQFTAVAGEILPLACKRVNSATTTATLMVALWRI